MPNLAPGFIFVVVSCLRGAVTMSILQSPAAPPGRRLPDLAKSHRDRVVGRLCLLGAVLFLKEEDHDLLPLCGAAADIEGVTEAGENDDERGMPLGRSAASEPSGRDSQSGIHELLRTMIDLMCVCELGLPTPAGSLLDSGSGCARVPGRLRRQREGNGTVREAARRSGTVTEATRLERFQFGFQF